MQPHAVTIQTLAHLAQCSRTTVSLALRNDPQIPAATRERILRLARETGYHPDSGLQGMPPPRQPTAPKFLASLGTLHTVSRRFAVETASYADWIMGAADRGAQMGYLFEDFWLNENGLTLAELESTLEARRIQGLLLPCYPNAERLPREFHSLLRRFPAAAAGYPCPDLPALPVAANDRPGAAVALFDRAVQAGYQRIGFVVSEGIEARGEQRLADSVADGFEHYPELVELPPLSLAAGQREEFFHWLALHRPDCIITTAEEVWDWLKEAGRSVPRDVGLLFWQLSSRGSGWSGMVQNDREIGAAALELIVRQLQGGAEGKTVQSRVLIESTWVEGSTIRSVAA